MLTRVVIENFQSHKKTELELGKFTVLVGPSSSGKTSVLRALEALATNPRGASVYTSSWAKRFVVTAHTSEGTVSFSVSSAGASYKVTTDEEKTYTKLNNTVPSEVEAVFGIRKEDVPLLFPDQFAGPYLLKDTGNSVAREFGSLTNIDKVYAAKQEGNKVKTAKSTKLKIRQLDLNNHLAQREDVTALEERLALCDSLEKKIDNLKILEDKIHVLGDLLKTLKAVESDIQTYKQVALPSPARLEKAWVEMSEFRYLLRDIGLAQKEATSRQEELDRCSKLVVKATREFNDSMAELGYCPLCERESHE